VLPRSFWQRRRGTFHLFIAASTFNTRMPLHIFATSPPLLAKLAGSGSGGQTCDSPDSTPPPPQCMDVVAATRDLYSAAYFACVPFISPWFVPSACARVLSGHYRNVPRLTSTGKTLLPAPPLLPTSPLPAVARCTATTPLTHVLPSPPSTPTAAPLPLTLQHLVRAFGWFRVRALWFPLRVAVPAFVAVYCGT